MDSLVSVVVDAEVSDLRHPFTYRVPEGRPAPPLGSAVVVPFGGNTLLGFVVETQVSGVGGRAGRPHLKSHDREGVVE